jgi:hypothetical protein
MVNYIDVSDRRRATPLLPGPTVPSWPADLGAALLCTIVECDRARGGGPEAVGALRQHACLLQRRQRRALTDWQQLSVRPLYTLFFVRQRVAEVPVVRPPHTGSRAASSPIVRLNFDAPVLGHFLAGRSTFYKCYRCSSMKL